MIDVLRKLVKRFFAYSIVIVKLIARGQYIIIIEVYCIVCLYIYINRDMIPGPLLVVLPCLCVEKLPDASGFDLHCTVGILYIGPWLRMTGAGSADIEIAFPATKYWI